MKKFLSLVLALIMTMSLVTISAGATEYRDLTDKDEIQYEEAVAVLNRIGVITGYEDGSFRPEGELTRGAAAKIIVSLLIGPEAASNLPNATAPYPDVPASHTFAGVISYCKTAKIISGYGDGTFKPGNSLTGFAFAKMLLGALGYKQEIEGFVDTGWTMNVAKVGNVTGLFDRLDFDGAAAVNRETACQLALNTLKATMVTYGGTTMVTGAQNMFVQGTQAMYVTSNNREINANINRRVINAANNEMTLEFGEEHFKDLRLEHDKYDPAYDEYGHPSNEWSWKKVTIGTFKLPADFTFTKQMSHLEDTAATKEKAVGLRNYDTWSTDHRVTSTNWSTASSASGWRSPFADATQITINGWNARVGSNGKISDYDASVFNNRNSKPDGVPTISEIADLTDNGVTVEVYVCPVDADFITNVVVTRTQLMKVKRIGSDYVTLEDIEPDSRDPRKDAKLHDIVGFNNFAIDVTEDYDAANKNSFLADVKDSNYDAYNALKDMKVGDRVAVVPYTTDNGKTWEVGEAYAPETVTGAFTKVDTYANVNKPEGSAVAITVGGTSYPINEWNKDMLNVKGPEIKATKKDVTLYLAKDGTALWADEIGNSDAWMIVGDYYQATNANLSGKVGWYVHGWTIGGDEVDLDLGTIRGDAEKYAPGELVYYKIAESGNGEYVLSKPNKLGVNHYKDGEPAYDIVNENGEGIYEVSQYTYDAADNTKAKQYQISKRNGALALENYGTNNVNPPYQYVLEKTTPTNDPAPAPAVPVKREDRRGKDDVAHEFKYSNLLYDGVKFIFVNFDAANGEVETIDFKDGVQNVDYQDLVRYNSTWRNIGTNDGFKYVVSAAEAYVNSKGVVKAVVIKADSSEADLSKIAVITDTPGDKNLNKGADDRTNGLSYAKQYVTGPSFSLAEEKTGYFDKDYPIGTILVISEKENIIVGKYFHSTYYNNGNPDAVYVEGIKTLQDTKGNDSEAGFLIGQTGSVVKTLNKVHTLTYDGVTNPEVVPGENRIVDILGQKYVSGFDTLVTGDTKDLSGLIRVDGNTTFVDLRAYNTDTIENMGDLLDYKPETLKLRLLVNGNDSTDTFRRAYAVIVEKAEPKDGSTVAPTDGVITLSDKCGKLLVGDAKKVFGSVELDKISGDLKLNVKATAPDWAKDGSGAYNTTVPLRIELRANDKSIGYRDVKASVDTSGAVAYSETVDIATAVNLGTISLNDVLTGEITSVTWAKAGVKYVYEDGTEVTTGLSKQDKFVDNNADDKVNFTYAMPGTHEAKADTTPAYSITGVTPEQSKVAYSDGVAVESAAIKANNDWVLVTINNVSAKVVKTYSVAADSGLELAVLASEPNDAADYASAEWKTSLTGVAKDAWIVVRAAGGTSKLTGVSARGGDMSTPAIATSQIPTNTGVWKFQMPADSVQVGGASTNALAIDQKFLTSDGSVLNVRLKTGSEYDPTDPAQVEKMAELLGSNFEAVDNPAGSGKVLKTTFGAIGTVNVADNLPYATIDGNLVVGSASGAKIGDLMTLIGITAPTDGFKFVKKGADGFVAGNTIASETAGANGNFGTYDTNDKGWYLKLSTTPVSLDADGKLTLATTNVTLGAANVLTSAGGDKYVGIGKAVTVTIHMGGTASGAIASGVKLIENTSTNCTVTLPTDVILVAETEKAEANETWDFDITLASATNAAGAQIKLKLADIT